MEVGILMGPSFAAVITLVALCVWHLQVRRHPSWSTCPDGRFYITIGYPAVAIAVYWLMNSSTVSGLEWARVTLWALAPPCPRSFTASTHSMPNPNDNILSHLDIESISEPQTSIDAH